MIYLNMYIIKQRLSEELGLNQRCKNRFSSHVSRMFVVGFKCKMYFIFIFVLPAV